MRKILMCLILISTMLLASCAAQQVYHQGNEAFSQGDYDASFADYLYASNQGIIPAKYALAYQYYYGLGTKTDTVKTIELLKSIKNRSKQAAVALHLIQQQSVAEPWAYKFKSFGTQ